jgi:hypothetical protein
MNINVFRRRLLLIHGIILTVVALGNAVVTTYCRITGAGPFGFLRQNPLAWVGLVQAYLLITIIAVLMIIGSRSPNPRKWNIVGALAHVPPLIAALTSLDVFTSLEAGGVVWIPIAFHAVFICLETMAAVWYYPVSGHRSRF